MKPLDTAAMIGFLVSGGLITMFGLFTILGTLTGGLLTVASIFSGDEEGLLVGIPVFLIYAIWMVVCLAGGPLQLVAGIQLARGKPKSTLTWVAAFSALVAGITVYCALPGMVAFGLGIAALVSDREPESAP